MSVAAKASGPATVIAVCSDHDMVERAIERLHHEGFDMRNVSVVGKDFEVVDKPAGFVTTGACARVGAEVGAFIAGIFGLCLGMAFIILPGIGPVIVAGELSAALLGAIEASTTGAAIGALAGALVGWGIPEVHTLKYETHVKGGKFLILARGDTKEIEHAKSVLHHVDQLEVYEQSGMEGMKKSE